MTFHSPGALELWYRQPAEHWVEALPIGNGRLGAMVFGGVSVERLQLNDDTLWTSGSTDWNNPRARDVLPEVRRLLFAGQYVAADELSKQMQGPFNQSYQPLGDLLLRFDHETEADYRRALDLDSATTSVRYTHDGATFTREAFVSAPDQAIVVRIGCDQPGRISFNATLGSLLRHTITPLGDDGLTLLGSCPTYDGYTDRQLAESYSYENGSGMRFALHLRAIAEGGRVRLVGDELHVEDADAVTLLLTAATSFAGFRQPPDARDPFAPALRDLEDAAHFSYAELHQRHVDDHQRLFRRVALDLGTTPAAQQPTDQRIRAFGEHDDPQLVTLLFQYGRYLLIASSRPGTQPANLQGIWNKELRPPWSSNWTLNINAQMNYWLAEPVNLAECHAPLLDFIADLSINGA
ncbi:MAG TPA: glycoside hydrolase family 95 protein, partial [Roseiflexaceae bacterium]|nr:glycoside hydrolase family 95 protein [Roseiflexaceae bacterium]